MTSSFTPCSAEAGVDMENTNPRWAWIRGGGRLRPYRSLLCKPEPGSRNIKAFSAFVLPEQHLYMWENGCRDQTSIDLVSHSFSVLSCFGVTRCSYMEWLMLALKALGCISLCVHVCGYVHLCVLPNAARSQSACGVSTRLHGDESFSWSAKTKIPPTHTSPRSIQMVWCVTVHRRCCAPEHCSANSCACKDTRMRVVVGGGGGWRWDWWGQIATNNNIHWVPGLYWNSRNALPSLHPVMITSRMKIF